MPESPEQAEDCCCGKNGEALAQAWAKPIQPISSRNPARIPKETPILGAVTRNAVVQEAVKVSAKYETAGCWQIKEDFAAEVDGDSMVNEGGYSSRPRGTMSEFSNKVIPLAHRGRSTR